MTFRPVTSARCWSRSRRRTSKVLPRALISLRRLCQVGTGFLVQRGGNCLDADEDLRSGWPFPHLHRRRVAAPPGFFRQTDLTEGRFNLFDRSSPHVTTSSLLN